MDTIEALGRRKLNVEFTKTGEKHRGACQYEVLVEGVRVGLLYKEYSPGFRSGHGVVGGSARGSGNYGCRV